MPGKKAQRLQEKAFALFFAGTAGKSGGKGRAGAAERGTAGLEAGGERQKESDKKGRGKRQSWGEC